MRCTFDDIHNSALKMLEIVHGICSDNGIRYTISSSTLINYQKIDFSECDPTIYISMLYDDFQCLEKYLADFCSNNKGYSIHNYKNTEQFNTLDMWFVKHSRVNIVRDNTENFYYGVKLVITPLFYVGNSYRQWISKYKYYRKGISAFNFLSLLPQKPFLSRIRQLPKRVLTRYYIKQRGKCTIDDIKNNLAEIQESEYILCPFIIPKFKSPNTVPYVMPSTSSKLNKNFWTDIKIINYYGVECFCVTDAEKYIKCLPKQYIEEVSKPNKSRLCIEGNEKLRRIQLIQVDLLREFDRICRKNNLRYNISFGTLLGAVRHKGFIPWDDDIDVTMPWEDYMKLDEAVKKDLNMEKYYYRTPETEENNHLIFKHLERKETLYTKPNRNKLSHKIGVFIDIFPMYPAAPNFVLDWFHAKICRFWRTALWSTVGAESEKNKLKRFFYHQTAKLGNKRCYANFVKAATFFTNKKGRLKFWIAMDRNPYNTALVKEDNYNYTTELDFEGFKFFAPQNYTEVLEYCFGKDWNLYPYVNARVPAHNAIIDIGNLYEFEEDEK